MSEQDDILADMEDPVVPEVAPEEVELPELPEEEGNPLPELAPDLDAQDDALDDLGGVEIAPPEPDGDESDLAERVAQLEEELEELRGRIPTEEPFRNPFVATVNADGTWQELFVGKGTDNSFTGSIRLCNDSTSTSALISLGETQSVILSVDTPTERKFIKVGGSSSGTSGGGGGGGGGGGTFTKYVMTDTASAIIGDEGMNLVGSLSLSAGNWLLFGTIRASLSASGDYDFATSHWSQNHTTALIRISGSEALDGDNAEINGPQMPVLTPGNYAQACAVAIPQMAVTLNNSDNYLTVLVTFNCDPANSGYTASKLDAAISITAVKLGEN